VAPLSHGGVSLCPLYANLKVKDRLLKAVSLHTHFREWMYVKGSIEVARSLTTEREV
jgi:hypothetical protein